uniref:LAGLIDADG endonuclease n=1 Tax=Clavaria fumosa TaxID=264083 RepID=A0A7T3PCR9_9AGAR|nr:LAGLIDADG endonuclease [Clavaria fumosa]QPZ51134.1 LAGLIDADG endonuclease [Clavaria fumosa]
MSKEEKENVSNSIPEWFNQIVCGLMLSDATLRMNGKNALMGIQQTHQELTQEILNMCFKLNLILSGIHVINRNNRQTVYSFQTLSLPYFTFLYNDWYKIIDGKRHKVLPPELHLESVFTPVAFAFFIMGDGSWDVHGSRLVLHTNNFTLNEVKRLQSILLSKFNLRSYLVKINLKIIPSNKDRGYIIKIPSKEIEKVRELVSKYIYPSLKYKLGM